MGKTLVKEIMVPSNKTLVAMEGEPVETAIKEFLAQPEVHELFIIDAQNKFKGAVKLHYILSWMKLRLGMDVIDRASIRTLDSLQAFEVVKLCQSETIADILSAFPEIKPTATLVEALHVMLLEQVVELPVVTPEGIFLGEVKLTQLLSKLLAENKNAGPVCETEA